MTDTDLNSHGLDAPNSIQNFAQRGKDSTRNSHKRGRCVAQSPKSDSYHNYEALLLFSKRILHSKNSGSVA